MTRIILHCDLNCFYASVEMLYKPQYRNIPMAVAGDKEKRHGIILAKNVLAKKAGVITGEAIFQAKNKCPNLTIVSPNHENYLYFSQKVKELYYQYTDQVEPFGIDECWLDITDSIKYFGSINNIINDLLTRIKNEIGLTLSIGVSYNKIYAKLGSDLAKEDDYYVISSLKDIASLSCDKLLNCGKATYEKLKSLGIYTIGQLSNKDVNYLKNVCGKAGEMLWCFANGYDYSKVKRYDENRETIKSIGHTSTGLRDLKDIDDVKLVLAILADCVAKRVTDNKLYFKVVSICTRTSDLKWKTYQFKLHENSDLAKDIYQTGLYLCNQHLDFKKTYRSLGVSVSEFSYQKEASDIDIFNYHNYSKKQKNQENAIREIRSRFGFNSISNLTKLTDTTLGNINPLGEEREINYY